MKLIFKVMLIYVLILSSLNIIAQTTESLFLERLLLVNATITSIQSNFEQTRNLAIMKEPLISSGIFYYKKPGLMKWDQQLPTPYYFIINGKKIIRFDGKERKVMLSNSPQIIHFKNFILGTIDGSMLTSENYATTYIKSGNIVKVELIPLQKSVLKRFAKIELVFEYEKMLLTKLVITEIGGDVMKIVFTNQQINTIENNTIFN